MADIYGNGVALTEKVLDHLWARQNVTLNNIANVDTPGYKYQYVTFEEELAERLSLARQQISSAREMGQAIRGSRITLHTTSGESDRLDGNNVDMDQEQTELARTTLQYQFMINSINNDLARLSSAVRAF